MIYVTGDTHRNVNKDKLFNFDYSGLTKSDYIIICGDFGFVWYGDYDQPILDLLEELPCSILFCDGNHEGFPLLNSYPVVEWNGGRVHQIRPHVLHLMRGEIYNIDNKKFFVFGGGESIDKECRKEGESWFPEELPTNEECEYALLNLERNDWKVDYVITHSAPDNILYRINPYFGHNILTNLLFVIDKQLEFKHWYFGHYHIDRQIDDQHTAIFKRIIKL